ncbi:MAG: hypothetical protein N838_10195 [Thiohalocapsa sp. PB-PSB1]|nr:MAG: hypothetical protein N838_10195 [Thiohalocapsa sp. PB-PSB1]
MRFPERQEGIHLYDSYASEPSCLSYSAFAERIFGAIEHFHALGVRPGTRVLFPFETNLQVIVSFFALIGMGAIPYSIRPLMSKSAAKSYIDFLERLEALAAPHYLLSTRLVEDLETPIQRLDLPPPSAQVKRTDRMHGAEPQGVAFVQFSSGSTSFPKGVVITHGNIFRNLSYIDSYVREVSGPVTPDDCATSWLPLYHDMGLIGGFLSPIAHGMPVHLASPNAFLLQPLEWLTHISRTRACYAPIPHFAVAYLLRRLAETDEHDRAQWDLSCLKLIFDGSEPVQWSDLQQFASVLADCGFNSGVLQPCYGMAEAVLIVSCATHLKPKRIRLANGQTSVSLGRVHPDYEVRLVDEEGHLCREGETGEILLKGGSLAPHYIGEIPQLYETDTFYHTGDVGLLADGELYVTGRISDRIKVNGESFFSVDFEAAVEQLDFIGLGRVAVFQSGQEIYVLVACGSARLARADESRRAIRQILNARLGVAVPPENILFVKPAQLKKTSSGKLKRNEIRDDFCAGRLRCQTWPTQESLNQ